MHLPDGVEAVLGLTGDAELAAGLEKVHQYAPDESAVVYDED
jgi:hypothetical protein